MTCCAISVRPETFGSAWDGWQAIVSSGMQATVFDLPAWQKTWWEHFGSGKRELILSVRSDERPFDLLAPLMREDGEVSFLGGTDLVDYHNFVCPGELSRTCLQALISELSSDRSINRLLFESVTGESPVCDVLSSVARDCGWDVSVEKEDVAPRLELPGGWDEYLADLRKKDRHELRRKLRRLEAAGEMRHFELSAAEDIESALDDFFELHRMSTRDKQEFMTADREKFFRDVSIALAEPGMTRLTFLELDGQKVATSLSFVVGGVRYLYNSGYNPEYSRLAVGLLNHALTIRTSISQGHSVFDFMRGNEPYKYHLGGVDREVFRIVATR